MNQTLYICYFGLREPLVQTQVLPYLREVAKNGVRVHLLTFEPEDAFSRPQEETGADRQALATSGIEWHFLRYHKRFSAVATAYDILCGAIFAWRLARREQIGVLHARSHIPLAMALIARKFADVRLIFDIRGLMAEEYVDAGIWREGSLPFRVIKRVERLGLRRADEVVVLTEKFKNYLVAEGLRAADSITVIPCCVDDSRGPFGDTGKHARFELIYAGSVTGLYMLEEMVKLFKVLKEFRPDAFFRVLTAGDQAYVNKVFSGAGIDPGDYSVQMVPPADVLDRIGRSHAAISFRKPTFSQIAASPTKIGEYLACGVPVIVNSGIGDTDRQIEDDGAGVVIDTFGRESYEKAVGRLLGMMEGPGIAENCRRAAGTRFDLRKVGGARYAALYAKLFDRK
jgi:glycosyltransferase involved in cell wall biosynthesis